jgi:hypothetical protein
MTISVDIHALVLPQTNQDWVKQMQESVEVAMARSPFPVHFHQLPGKLGHLGQVRAEGYALGNSPYVTFVDDDDFLLPEAFELVAEALEKRPAAVFPAEYTLQNGTQVYFKRRHHLPLYRRELIIDHTQYQEDGDWRQVIWVEQSGLEIIDLDAPAYVYRLRMNSPARLMRREIRLQALLSSSTK